MSAEASAGVGRPLDHEKNRETAAEARELAHACTHMTRDVLVAFLESRLSEVESTNARRHVLFCQSCSALVIREVQKRRAAEGLGAVTPAPKRSDTRTASEAPPPPTPGFVVRPAARRRRLLPRPVRIGALTAAFLCVLGPAALWVAPEEGEIVHVIAASELEAVESGRRHPAAAGMTQGAELVLRLGTATHPRHAYVLLVTPGAGPRLLHPDPGPAPALPAAGGRTLPAADAAFRARRWTPPASPDGGRVIVLQSRRRIPVLEGALAAEGGLRWLDARVDLADPDVREMAARVIRATGADLVESIPYGPVREPGTPTLARR